MTKPLAINIGGPHPGDPKQPMPGSGLDDTEVRAMAQQCGATGTLPAPGWLARLDAKQAAVFRAALAKKKGRAR